MMQLDMFPTTLHMRCIDPAQNKRRFYRLSVQCNLFGEWELQREWGRIGSLGRTQRKVYPSPGTALDALKDMAIRKERRGYTA
ncbi:WGR domain-containing protein [Roseibium sp. TrichSKD4]|uniref:WGR domain-containing protein n=1 Tax=Roseibium sp. TrichSKD4 TaxID=744980 RepID=UPI0001E5712F|nr:WGR domain-containing protein [Roseibium sp. TrichSKD4]EFO28697.1 WGR domain-containing protein [Roseibium sp. TrichSKD4]